MQIYTIGHSNISLQNFIISLAAYKVQKLIDVRSHPGSRHVPWCNKEALPNSLKTAGIDYAHFLALGGRRKNKNKNDMQAVSGWKNESFKSYASYTLTDEYQEGILQLIAQAKQKTVCIMCAESVPWRCHRLLISNTLVTKGIDVVHIISPTQSIPHRLNLYGAHARLDNGRLIYPE